MLYTSIIISAKILRITKLVIRPSWQCINGKRGSVSSDIRNSMTVVTCRRAHYSFDPKVGSLSMSVVLAWLNSCLGSHAMYWVGLHWTAVFVRMLRFGPSGVQQAPVQYGHTQYPAFKALNNTKVIQNTEHRKDGQWRSMNCNSLQVVNAPLYTQGDWDQPRQTSVRMLYVRPKIEPVTSWIPVKRAPAWFLRVVQMFKLQSPGIWRTKMSLSTSCNILQNILNEGPESDSAVWVAACLRTMMIGLFQVDATILHSIM